MRIVHLDVKSMNYLVHREEVLQDDEENHQNHHPNPAAARPPFKLDLPPGSLASQTHHASSDSVHSAGLTASLNGDSPYNRYCTIYYYLLSIAH
jgi:hypothetical protein